MKYNQEIEREIQLSEQDFLDLFRDQEAVDDGTRIHIRKLDFIRALGRLDPMPADPDEREELVEKYGTPDSGEIATEEMDTMYEPEVRERRYDQLLYNLSISGEITIEAVHDNYGEWAEERLRDEENVDWHSGYKSFAWAGDEVYDK